MVFTVGTITRCTGQTHFHVPVTISGVERTITVDATELGLDFSETSARDRIVDRLRSARKEANAVSFAQTKTALEGKVLQI